MFFSTQARAAMSVSFTCHISPAQSPNRPSEKEEDARSVGTIKTAKTHDIITLSAHGIEAVGSFLSLPKPSMFLSFDRSNANKQTMCFAGFCSGN